MLFHIVGMTVGCLNKYVHYTDMITKFKKMPYPTPSYSACIQALMVKLIKVN